MSKYEKIAWFWLAVFTVSVVLYLVLFLLLKAKLGPFLSAQVAHSAFALIALCAFGPLIFKRKENDSGVIDEQGTITKKKLTWYKYVLLGAIYISIFIGVWAWTKVTGTISDQVIVLIVFSYTTMIALLVFILSLYLKQQKESKLVTDEQDVTDLLLFGPDMDERDLQIQQTARWGAFGVFWVCYIFGITGMWGWAWYRGYHSISVDIRVLPLFVFDATILIIVIHSIISVILYRRSNHTKSPNRHALL